MPDHQAGQQYDPYVPPGPVETDPICFSPDERRPAVEHVLRGVRLGAYVLIDVCAALS
jgi:hypothetical protein